MLSVEWCETAYPGVAGGGSGLYPAPLAGPDSGAPPLPPCVASGLPVSGGLLAYDIPAVKCSLMWNCMSRCCRWMAGACTPLHWPGQNLGPPHCPPVLSLACLCLGVPPRPWPSSDQAASLSVTPGTDSPWRPNFPPPTPTFRMSSSLSQIGAELSPTLPFKLTLLLNTLIQLVVDFNDLVLDWMLAVFKIFDQMIYN